MTVLGFCNTCPSPEIDRGKQALVKTNTTCAFQCRAHARLDSVLAFSYHISRSQSFQDICFKVVPLKSLVSPIHYLVA